MSLMCEVSAPFVANAAVDEKDVVRPLRGHTSSCLRCQARHAAMSRTARELTLMGDVKLEASADLEWRVMAALEGDPAVTRSWQTPAAVLAGIVSMGVALVVWRLRPRTG